jgi:hypothetical protein
MNRKIFSFISQKFNFFAHFKLKNFFFDIQEWLIHKGEKKINDLMDGYSFSNLLKSFIIFFLSS